MFIGRPVGNFLPLSGGILTGDLTISKAAPVIHLEDTANLFSRFRASRQDTGATMELSADFASRRLGLTGAAGGGATVAWNVDSTRQLLGILPLARMQREEQTAFNAGAVTVTAAGVGIVSVVLGAMSVGDRVLVGGVARLLKGGTSGATLIALGQTAGTAVGQWYGGSVSPRQLEPTHPNATTLEPSVFGIYEITTAGTATMRLDGTSAGSDSTVAIADAGIIALVLRAD